MNRQVRAVGGLVQATAQAREQDFNLRRALDLWLGEGGPDRQAVQATTVLDTVTCFSANADRDPGVDHRDPVIQAVLVSGVETANGVAVSYEPG